MEPTRPSNPKRLIRVDDYPWGEPVRIPSNFRTAVGQVLEIFNRHQVDYILGATPELLSDEDIIFLDNAVVTGNVVMHGFNHHFNFQPWNRITETWPHGGEFQGMSIQDIQNRYNEADKKLSRIRKYDPRHFIAPFNCYTQNLVDALKQTKVTFLHTCDKEYDAYGYEKLDYGDIKPVVSKYHVTYDYASEVIKHLDDPSQITLHWMYDCRRPDWKQHYVNLCRAL